MKTMSEQKMQFIEGGAMTPGKDSGPNICDADWQLNGGTCFLLP